MIELFEGLKVVELVFCLAFVVALLCGSAKTGRSADTSADTSTEDTKANQPRPQKRERRKRHWSKATFQGEPRFRR
jgi:hypothetical protein